MADLAHIPEAMRAEWDKEVSDSPAAVRATAEQIVPWKLYKIRSTGDRVLIKGYHDDGSLTVIVSGL
jgi:hypothetical protein